MDDLHNYVSHCTGDDLHLCSVSFEMCSVCHVVYRLQHCWSIVFVFLSVYKGNVLMMS